MHCSSEQLCRTRGLLMGRAGWQVTKVGRGQKLGDNAEAVPFSDMTVEDLLRIVRSPPPRRRALSRPSAAACSTWTRAPWQRCSKSCTKWACPTGALTLLAPRPACQQSHAHHTTKAGSGMRLRCLTGGAGHVVVKAELVGMSEQGS